MGNYLIEFRFHGKAKYEIKKLVYEINKKFRLGNKRAIPHITLVGPFDTNDEKRLIGDFNRLCSKSHIMKFRTGDYSFFEKKNNNVVFLDIQPSEELEKFRWDLSQKLKPYCKLKSIDHKKIFTFHATLAMRLSDKKFYKIKNYLRRKPKLKFNHVMVRATLLKNGRILREYDFFLRRPLGRYLSKSKKVYAQTSDLLKGYFENRFDPNKFKGERVNIRDKGFIDKIKAFFRKPKIFITSDLHLDHTNIINFCKRPFLNIENMNKTLISNWNNIISNKDKVYFLGDLAYGRGSKSTDYWLKKLNGKITFIRGNHDKSNNIPFHESYILEYRGYEFFLSHEPEKVPKDWDGWVICGHHHNNKPLKYPFIDKNNKIINISTDLTKFRPVNIDELIKNIEE